MSLFCLHGFLGSAEDWNRALPGWENVESFDWLRDPELGKCDNWSSLAERINSWAGKYENTGSRILLGYSQGGRIALHALLQQPELWDGAVIISAHPGLKTETERLARIETDRLWGKKIQTENWAELMRAWNSQPVLQGETTPERKEDPGIRQALAHAIETWSLGRQQDLRPALSLVSFPILWLAGEKDTKYLALAKECSELNPAFEFASIAGGGHRAPWSANERFQFLLKNWLGKNRIC